MTLARFTATRSSDVELIIAVWQAQGLNLTETQKEMLRSVCMHPETMTRIRRKLQEQGKYRATKEVEQARYDKFQNVKGNVGVANAEQTEQLLNETPKAINVGLEF
jgi:hypothetical protein